MVSRWTKVNGGRRAGPERAMGEEACSPNCAGRLSGRQLSATVLVEPEVPHHRHQRLRRNHQPRKQRLLPTLNWQMSVTPSSRSRTPEQHADDPLRSEISPPGDHPPPSILGSTFTRQIQSHIAKIVIYPFSYLRKWTSYMLISLLI